MKFAMEHQNPLVTGPVIGVTNSPYASTNYSLLNIGDPQVLLWALKPHEDGINHGLVVRLWNLAANAVTTKLTTPMTIRSAQRLTHIETAKEPLTIKENVIEIPVGSQSLSSCGLK
jgi:alpha-mannosidase